MDPKETGQKPLVLVVDDDVSLRLFLRAALIKANFDVLEAESGPQALVLFQAEKPDLILQDVIMPDMDGFETCAAIRKLPGGNEVQILMVTGLDDVESVEKSFQAGANDFISKPLNWQLLGYKAKYMFRAGQAFRAIEQSKKRLQKTQEIARIGNWEIDLATNEFHCSADTCQLLGYDDKTDTGLSFKEFLAPVVDADQGQVQDKINSALKNRQPFDVHCRIMLKGKTERHILNQAEILYNASGRPEIMMGVIQDVTKMKHAEQEIRQLAFYDSLTGLANRWLFQDRLEHQINKAKRGKEKFALLFLDIDHFKKINDTYGHNIGDILLKNMGKTIEECVRDSDTICREKEDEMHSTVSRFGGDEFIVLLADIKDPENAADVARRIIKKIPVPHDIEGNVLSVTASIGISIFPTDGTEADVLFKNADVAMYQAKESGRNSFKFFDKSLNAAAIEKFSLEADLSKAIEREELLLYYQPKINIVTREIVGAEALVRWLHPLKAIIPPDKFIPLAEESGMITQINKWLIGEACRQNNEWVKAGSGPLPIAINISGFQLGTQNLENNFQENLKKNNLDPKYLEVEITESVLMQDSDETFAMLEQLKEMQIKISLDDFGTGYSSLSYLTMFKVNAIKIDRSFVMGCTLRKSNLVIIKAIVAMANSLGMKIIAEGIETVEQYEILRELGVQEGQGYLFSPPVPAEKFIQLLQKGTL